MNEPQRAELYGLDDRKLPERWVWYLPQGAVIGRTKAECAANYLQEQVGNNPNGIPTRPVR